MFDLELALTFTFDHFAPKPKTKVMEFSSDNVKWWKQTVMDGDRNAVFWLFAVSHQQNNERFPT